MRRPDLAAIIQALGGHGSGDRPSNLDVAAYLARVDGWRSFDSIGEELGWSRLAVLRELNRVSSAIRYGNKSITELVARGRGQMRADETEAPAKPAPALEVSRPVRKAASPAAEKRNLYEMLAAAARNTAALSRKDEE